MIGNSLFFDERPEFQVHTPMQLRVLYILCYSLVCGIVFDGIVEKRNNFTELIEEKKKHK